MGVDQRGRGKAGRGHGHGHHHGHANRNHPDEPASGETGGGSGHSRTHRRWVVDDSIPWKDELVKLLTYWKAKTKQTRWTDRTGYRIERDFMPSVYPLRKLIDS